MAAVAPKNIYAKHRQSVSAWSGLLHCPIFEPKRLRKHGWRRCIMDESSTSRRADAMQIKILCRSATRLFGQIHGVSTAVSYPAFHRCA